MPTTRHVSDSLLSLLDNPAIKVLSDRSEDIEPLAKNYLVQWAVDLYSRKPSPAANSLGEFVGTDLDLSTFLSALVDRRAVINLPEKYISMRPKTSRPEERVISESNRHGHIIGLFSNATAFSFGVKILDQNVVYQNPITGEEKVGAPRNFTLLDVTGKWYDGWHSIEFSPSSKENDFLSDRKLWTDNTIYFKHFVHPNRWQSFYGLPYILTKCLIDRLRQEASHLSQEIKRLLDEGVTPPDTTAPKLEYTFGALAKGKPKEVVAFESRVDIPEFIGEYPQVSSDTSGLYCAKQKLSRIRYEYLPVLDFAVRSVELAFARFGFEGDRPSENQSFVVPNTAEKFPAWIQSSWQRDYVLPGKRIKWNRLSLFQPRPGQRSVSLRYRIWQKNEILVGETNDG